MKDYHKDLSFIQNSNNNLIVNTDIMTITGFMDDSQKVDHITRYAGYILEKEDCPRTRAILAKYDYS